MAASSRGKIKRNGFVLRQFVRNVEGLWFVNEL